jgi:hypothetical protein
MIAGLLILLAACTSLPTTLAPWDASPGALRQVFPDSEYIAQRGRGKTREAAEADAAAQVARFLNTQLSSQTRAVERYSEENGNLQTNRELETEVFVRSQMDLFGIRYARDAYFDKLQKEWISVAYIDREEAWQIYEPRFKQQAEAFHRLFLAADEDSDSFRKVFRYLSAQNYARSPEYQNADSFGQILYPEKMNDEFGQVRTELASLPQKIESSRRNAAVFIDCPLDFESLVSNAFSSRFSALGFPVTGTRNAAAAICRITVDEGMQQRELGIFYFPSLQAVLTGSSGALFSFSAEGERASAVTPDVAKRRAYQSLADKVNQSFSLEIN